MWLFVGTRAQPPRPHAANRAVFDFFMPKMTRVDVAQGEVDEYIRADDARSALCRLIDLDSHLVQPDFSYQG